MYVTVESILLAQVGASWSDLAEDGCLQRGHHRMVFLTPVPSVRTAQDMEVKGI